MEYRDGIEYRDTKPFVNPASAIKTWMQQNVLKLNSDKTELLLIGTKSTLTKDDTTVSPSPQTHNLGVILHTTLSFDHKIRLSNPHSSTTATLQKSGPSTPILPLKSSYKHSSPPVLTTPTHCSPVSTQAPP
jgi:hypothetical protein